MSTTKRIGILGGGQLAMMMAEAAHKIGHHVFVLDPTANCPASMVGAKVNVGSFKIRNDIYDFVKDSQLDVLTWDIESVDADTLIELQNNPEISLEIHPDPYVLKIIQNKWNQKQFLKQCSPDMTNHVWQVDDWYEQTLPFILKTKYGGYDGKGVWRVDTVAEMNTIITESGLPCKQFYCEQWVEHNGEFATQVCLSNNEIIDIYRLVETIQDPKYGICTKTTTHSKRVDSNSITMTKLEDRAYKIAERLCEKFTTLGYSYTGILSIEFFLTKDNKLIINELSPRVHNSGHYTIEGCHVSQFESHIRLIVNDNIDIINAQSMNPKIEYIMVNILATGNNSKDICTAYNKTHMHWYNKLKRIGESNHSLNRKLGHYIYFHVPKDFYKQNKATPKLSLPSSNSNSNSNPTPKIYIVMGSSSDLTQMQPCIDIVKTHNIPFKVDIVSAHRSPEWMFEFGRNVQSWGGEVVIAAAGGAAHLPGMLASLTNLPVIGVPIETKALGGQDSLYSIVQMPDGVPVATVGIGKSKNAAILAFKILGEYGIVEKIKISNLDKVEKQRASLHNS